MIDNLILIDNSKDGGEAVLEINDGNITFKADTLPKWSQPLLKDFKNKPSI